MILGFVCGLLVGLLLWGYLLFHIEAIWDWWNRHLHGPKPPQYLGD